MGSAMPVIPLPLVFFISPHDFIVEKINWPLRLQDPFGHGTVTDLHWHGELRLALPLEYVVFISVNIQIELVLDVNHLIFIESIGCLNMCRILHQLDIWQYGISIEFVDGCNRMSNSDVHIKYSPKRL
jgi:hypothetical protein